MRRLIKLGLVVFSLLLLSLAHAESTSQDTSTSSNFTNTPNTHLQADKSTAMKEHQKYYRNKYSKERLKHRDRLFKQRQRFSKQRYQKQEKIQAHAQSDKMYVDEAAKKKRQKHQNQLSSLFSNKEKHGMQRLRKPKDKRKLNPREKLKQQKAKHPIFSTSLRGNETGIQSAREVEKGLTPSHRKPRAFPYALTPGQGIHSKHHTQHQFGKNKKNQRQFQMGSNARGELHRRVKEIKQKEYEAQKQFQ